MRSWSVSVGRMFGVDIRIHLTFLILPVFVYLTDYATRQQKANGGRDLALVGIILACVAAHEFGHMLAARRYGLIPKAVILLPLTGVALYDEARVEKQPAALMWKREVRIALIGPLVNLALDGELMAYRHTGFWHPMDSSRDHKYLNDLHATGEAPWVMSEPAGPVVNKRLAA